MNKIHQELNIYINVYNADIKKRSLYTYSYCNIGYFRITGEITFDCWFFHFSHNQIYDTNNKNKKIIPKFKNNTIKICPLIISKNNKKFKNKCTKKTRLKLRNNNYK